MAVITHLRNASVFGSAINPCGALLAKWNDNSAIKCAAIDKDARQRWLEKSVLIFVDNVDINEFQV